MQVESIQKKEILLPTSLLEDIEFDQLDKELQSIQIKENNDPEIKGIYILFIFYIFIVHLYYS